MWQRYKANDRLYQSEYSMRQKILLQLPIVLIVAYLLFTLLLYAVGPFAWKTPTPVKFWLLQLCYIVMLYLGFQVGVRTRTRRKDNWNWDTRGDTVVLKLMPVLLAINLVYIVVNLFRSFGYSTWDFRGLIEDLFFGIQNLGGGYSIHQGLMDSLDGNQVLGGYIVTAINYLWNFFSFAVVLFGILYFTRMKMGSRILASANVVLILVNYVSIGTNIGVFRIVMAIAMFVMISYLKQIFRSFDKKKKQQMIFVVGLALTAIVVVLVYFVQTMKGRGGILNWDSESYNVGGVGLNRDSVMFKIFPESMYIPMISISNYLTQGYYGLALCMSLPWVPTYGLGSSLQIVDLFSDHLFDIRTSTYQFRAIVFGWDDRINWHSMYSWFANDVSFYGVIVLMFVIGLVFAMVYKDSITTRNPFARVLVFYFTLMFVFIPCNNQIIQTTYTLFSFVTVLFCWIVTGNAKLRGLVNSLSFLLKGRQGC